MDNLNHHRLQRTFIANSPLYPDQLVQRSLESLMFEPVEEDVSIDWNKEDVLDGEDRVHGHVDLAGGLGVVRHGGVLVPVAGYEACTDHRAVGDHHDPAEREKQHQGRVFVTATILSI